MSDAVPISVQADGSLKVLWVPAIATPAEPTIDELTDGTVIDLSCYLTADGFTPSTDEQVSNDDRLCTRQTFELPGRFTEMLEISYVYQGQDLEATDNKAYSTLRHKETGYVAARWGADYEIDVVVGDLLDIYPATCGIQRKQPPAANERLRVMQKIFVTNVLHRDAAVVAS